MGIALNSGRAVGLRAGIGIIGILLAGSCAIPEGAPLADTRWLVTSVDETSTAPATRPLVVFGADDTLVGFGGCNDFRGTYETSADRLRIGALGSTVSSCGDSPGKALEETLFDVLRSDPFFDLSDDSLRLTSPDGTTVLLQADPVEEAD